jgi:hypothetical protein
MRITIFVPVLSSLMALAVFVPLRLDGTDKPASEKPQKKEEAKVVSIPKKDIYTSGSELGFKERLRALFERGEGGQSDKPVHKYTRDLGEILKHRSPTNLFLVRGYDVAEAIKDTRKVYVSGWPDNPEPADENFWLVVYLGTSHSVPCKWTYQSCTVKGNAIEFVYKTFEERGPATTDLMPYFYWVPLPKLETGTFELKLIDAKNGPKLIRVVDYP